LHLTTDLPVVKNFADNQAFGEYGLVSTELFIVSTIIGELWISVIRHRNAAYS